MALINKIINLWNSLKIFFVWTTCFAIMFMIGAGGYFIKISHFSGPTTKMENSRLPVNNVFHAFDNLTLFFETTRMPISAGCDLYVTRYVKKIENDPPPKVGDQDHIIQQVTQHIRPDQANGIKQTSHYTANLGGDLPPGNYVVWSYVKYDCNPADWFITHELVTDKVPFKIVPDEVEIK
jgi:hypothetical protein